MVACLERTEGNTDFHQIVDFLNASTIRYSLTISPTIYVSYIEQFWATAMSKIVNNETQIHAKVDGKTIVISESSMRSNLHFNDEDGVTSLTNFEILENLVLMGYEIVSDKLTFQKAFFSSQWKYLIHTTLHCLKLFNDTYETPKHTQKVFANMRRKGKKISWTITPLFASMLVPQVVEGEGSGQPSEPQPSPLTALLGFKDFKMIFRVTTAQLQLLEGLMLSDMRSKTYQRRDKASGKGPIPPKTAEQKLARKNELKEKSTLLLAIPDEHQLKFHGIKDAKTL
ncbi:hypothetical protein Tco_1111157 [Tanacetum coccineum]|uniref:Uncharacterized protein n=1 Tax=Tanacetum coccineum TaxID=301880 RepID=A0ABQ5IKS9_9ASTR